MSPNRKDFLATVLELMGTLYKWGGKSPEVGLDCSGFVTYGLWKVGGPDWRDTKNTDALFAELPQTGDILAPGDLCFYGLKDNPNHVMVWIVDGLVVGASGGNSDTLTQADAIKNNARVKIKRSYLYRRDFIGFRRIPFLDT